jgi:hypothetical protein
MNVKAGGNNRLVPGAPEESGSLMERLIFGKRPLVLILFSIVTIVLGYQATKLRPEASFLDMIPTHHPYIQNYIKHQEELKGMGNTVRIAVETVRGDIFNQEYLLTLQKIHDDVFFVPGVDRRGVKSLWAPQTRWHVVTEEGFEAGQVIDSGYDGSPSSLEQVRENVIKSGEVGQIVANNFKSSLVFAPLLDFNPNTGEPLDYYELSKELEIIRDKYQTDDIKIHITGFAKVIGDLIEGANKVFFFFGIAFVLLILLLYFTSKCIRSTLVRGISSMVAVIWQLGLLQIFGYGLNPYSMLVPFLMFALGVSHGIQMGNAMTHEMMCGADKELAARLAFRKMYIPGFSALFTDAIGFATLFVIAIVAIQDIAAGATLGVIVVGFTDLILLPVLMSYFGVSKKAIDKRRLDEDESYRHPLSHRLSSLTRTKPAAVLISITFVAICFGFYKKQDLKIGDLEPGAPELRTDSRYNLDNAFMNKNFSISSDLFVVMVETKPNYLSNNRVVSAMENLQWKLEGLEGVQSTKSLTTVAKDIAMGFNEGSPKWWTIISYEPVMNSAFGQTVTTVRNAGWDLGWIYVYLDNHKAETLTRVVNTVEDFAARNNTEDYRFLMAAGNSGIEAATNIEIEKAQHLMTILVYTVVFIVCLITFRSFKGAVCVVIPLYLTSILCEVMMTYLGIGIKVATLPVIAVGVGVGVDYGIYFYSKLKELLAEGKTLEDAMYYALKTTGRAVIFTGTVLGLGVGTWIFSPIKFQADMGILLTFMFVWNMVGALILMPALVRFIIRPDSAKIATDRARLALIGPQEDNNERIVANE